MSPRIPVAALAWLLCSGALAAEPPAAAPPEDQTASGGTQAAPDRYPEVTRQVQEKLRTLGFYDGPVNGDFGPNTQAALAQFQLSVPLPASGSPDEATLAALGIERQPQQ
jgi:peptidoglycan hydrolase-like protein with peptidoglycan-binding domain